MSYANPVVRGTAPDPSAIRVGEDYYLATSSFDQLPGVTIRHSTDLVTWRIVGHAITRASQYRRDGRPGPMVLFAPTLRHHDGVFYVACTNAVRGEGNFVVSTTDVTGEWSDALWIDEGGFDPSLFRDDDGTWYYTRRNLEFRSDGNLGPIVQATIDLGTGELGELRAITPPHGFASNDIEGAHLYRRGEWYYLCSAEGGSWRGHMQTIARSRSPWGPFESGPQNPFLTQRHSVADRVQTLGHADLYDAADGSSWLVALGTRHPRMAQHHNLGRETFLVPVTWVDGWPRAGVAQDGTTSLIVDAALPAPARGTAFDVANTLWYRGWRTIGAAPTGLDADAADAAIDLPAGPHPADAKAAVAPAPCGALLRAQTEDDQSFRARLLEQPDALTAGIAAFVDARHWYGLTVGRDADGVRRVTLTRTVDDLVAFTSAAVPDGPVELAIDGHETEYRFHARCSGQDLDLGAGSARLLSAETAQWFVGVHWTLLAIGEAGSGAAKFREVEVVNTEPGPPASPVPF